MIVTDRQTDRQTDTALQHRPCSCTALCSTNWDPEQQCMFGTATMQYFPHCVWSTSGKSGDDNQFSVTVSHNTLIRQLYFH